MWDDGERDFWSLQEMLPMHQGLFFHPAEDVFRPDGVINDDADCQHERDMLMLFSVNPSQFITMNVAMSEMESKGRRSALSANRVERAESSPTRSRRAPNAVLLRAVMY